MFILEKEGPTLEEESDVRQKVPLDCNRRWNASSTSSSDLGRNDSCSYEKDGSVTSGECRISLGGR